MENSVTRSAKRQDVRSSKPFRTGKVITEEDIRRRAYEIYIENGGNSDALENWLRAEKELKGSVH